MEKLLISSELSLLNLSLTKKASEKTFTLIVGLSKENGSLQITKKKIPYPYQVDVISWQLKDGKETLSNLPPKTPFFLKGAQSALVLASPFKTREGEGDVTSKDIKDLMEQANYTNKYLQTLGESQTNDSSGKGKGKVKIEPSSSSAPPDTKGCQLEKPLFKPFQISSRSRHSAQSLRAKNESDNELLQKVVEQLKLLNQVVPESPATTPVAASAPVPPTAASEPVIRRSSARNTSASLNNIEEGESDVQSVKSIPAVNPVIHNSKNQWRKETKLYYPRATAPDLLLEEKDSSNFKSFSANNGCPKKPKPRKQDPPPRQQWRRKSSRNHDRKPKPRSKPHSTQAAKTPPENRPSQGKDVTCYNCGKPGHISRYSRHSAQSLRAKNESDNELLQKVVEQLKLLNQVVPESPATTPVAASAPVPPTAASEPVIRRSSARNTSASLNNIEEGESDVQSVKSIPAVNPVIHNSKNQWRKETKLYYPRVTAPDLLLEEKDSSNFKSFRAQSTPVLASPFKTREGEGDVTSKDIKDLMEQANYTNKYLQTLGESQTHDSSSSGKGKGKV
ncbi:uncharacterized protein LOC130725379 [Lotus japonicus]|uniref:uncharacterized protein LOC130725379 n=1 Tax=Lotus japonicus TaxID=34305 RepID=UPI00258AEE4D|nr:uncharacterized protein LOC130725379 [Lotus japonicus]